VSHVLVFLLLLLFGSAYALWRGGAPERLGAGIILAGVVASALVASGASHRWNSVEFGLLLVDATVLVAFIALLVRANRLWPILMTSLLTLQVAGHFLKGMDPHLYPFLYWMTSSLWGYLMVVVLIAGTYLHRSRLRRLGHDASWNSSWRLSAASDPAE
jgi:hypothetical protein